MTKQEMKKEMQAIRATYAGYARKLDAYKKNLKRINWINGMQDSFRDREFKRVPAYLFSIQ